MDPRPVVGDELLRGDGLAVQLDLEFLLQLQAGQLRDRDLHLEFGRVVDAHLEPGGHIAGQGHVPHRR